MEDLPAARSFYERVFGRTAAFEDDSSAAFKFDNTLINLVDTRAARDVIAPVAVASPSAGSRFLLTIWVGNVDAACAELASQGVVLLNGPVDRPWGMRTASFTRTIGRAKRSRPPQTSSSTTSTQPRQPSSGGEYLPDRHAYRTTREPLPAVGLLPA